MIHKPDNNNSPVYCIYYFNLVKEADLLEALKNSLDMTLEFISGIPPEKENYFYSEGKWTLKQVLSHIADCERIYAYRALRFSRKDNTPLAGFEEDEYAVNANTEKRTLKEIKEEYKAIRESNIVLFKYMTDEMLDFQALANNMLYSPRSLGWMAAGHNIHHCRIIKERYL
jgi:uncharacterized damage-inducible protein DinB